jgi:DNA modification methylase
MARRRGIAVRAFQKERVRAREEIERSWSDRIDPDPSFEDLVTGARSGEEPFHRWLPFRQQFAPGLVRRFLEEARPADPVLDPFSGSGTVVIECARARRAAIGVEGIEVLAWLTVARFGAVDPALLTDVLVAGRGVTGEGRPKVTAASPEVASVVGRMIAEDCVRPLAGAPAVVVGDARRVPLADGSIGGVLTSPPYLSRYDYSRITAAMDAVWRRSGRSGEAPQLTATLKSRRRVAPEPEAAGVDLPEAAREAVAAVRNLGRKRDADVIHTYFHDLMRALTELYRVTRAGAPVWIVIGAADFEREYVPADLIAAEMCARLGFDVESVVEARKLRRSERRLGGLERVAPRESIVQARRPVA